MWLHLEPLESRVTPVILPPDVSLNQVFETFTIVTSITPSPDGRIFYTQKDLGIRVIKDGQLLEQPFVQLPVHAEGEQGVAGMALDPNFVSNGFVYVYYTHLTPEGTAVNRITRFRANGDVAESGSETVIFQLSRKSNYNHIGGALHFGPDGKLYVAVGDHNNPPEAQSLDSLVGKILRINPDGSIPVDNPFYFRATGLNKAIWAFGFRNPFTFDISQKTGRLFANDVGSIYWEELNEVRPGGNYGWPQQEGLPAPGVVGPIYTYKHGGSFPDGNAITGGVFYEPDTPSLPERYVGRYFFGEFTNRFVNTYDPATGQIENFSQQFPDSLLDFDVDSEGNLLVLGIGGRPLTPNVISSRIYRLRVGGSQAPTVLDEPDDTFVSVVQPGRFAISATGEGALTYEWTRNGVPIPDANGPELTLTNLTTADDGSQIQVTVRNAFGAALSRVATLRVTSDLPPQITITTPQNGSLFSMGETIRFTGSATDPETGRLPDDVLSWRVEYHTGVVSRPFAEGIVGPSGEFTIPETTPYTKTDVFYRLILTARDPAGLVESVSLDLQPRIVELTFESSIPNAVLLDGRIVASGEVVQAVSGVRRELSARREVIIDGNRYGFTGWSDGGARTHSITFDGTARTYRAEYQLLGPAPKASLGASSIGVAELRRPDGSTLIVQPFGADYAGMLSVASGDVTGDGQADLIVGAGPGGGPIVVIYDGASGTELTRFFAFESSFVGGVLVAVGDLDDDGVAEVLVSPDLGGGPVVAIFASRDFTERARFFGIEDPNFRGGARLGVADINGDGPADILVAAGFGGGPRVAVFDGAGLFAAIAGGGAPPKLFDDFFAFEASLRNGVFIAGGDLEGDGAGELVLGGGPGGGPRLRIFSGTRLLNGESPDQATVGDFFAGDVNRRDGVRVAAKDFSGDGVAEIAAGLGEEVLVYDATTILGGEPEIGERFDPFPDLAGSIFVG